MMANHPVEPWKKLVVFVVVVLAVAVITLATLRGVRRG